MINRIFFLIFLVLYPCLSHSYVNLILNKSYSLSPNPNYGLSSDDLLRTLLTDGYYTTGHFWTSKTTVGWNQSGLIRLDFDLNEFCKINDIHVRTARGIKSGVSFPSRADVYVSADLKNYKYAGNIFEGADLSDGDYLVRQFHSPLINASARYVTIFISPKGNYTFLDEVEIFGEPAVNNDTVYTISDAQLIPYQNNILSVEHSKKTLLYLRDRQRKSGVTSFFDVDADYEISRLFEANVDHLRNYHQKCLLFWNGSPWDVFTPVDIPSLEPLNIPSLNFQMLTNGTSCQSVNFISTYPKISDVDVSIVWNDSHANHPEILIQESIPVSTKSGTVLCDPLRPIKDKILLNPGEARQLFLTAKGDVPSGNFAGFLRVVCSENASKFMIPFQVRVFQKSALGGDLPCSNTWAYLSWRLIKDIPNKALQDLQTHHVNIGIIHPSQIPWPKADTHALSVAEVVKFDGMLSSLKGSRYILLFLHLRDDKILEKFGNYTDKALWNEALEKWITSIRERCIKVGYDPEKILFYPVDEPQNSAHVEKIVNFSEVLKKVDPQLRTYTTIDRIGRLSKSDFYSLAQACSVLQIEENDLLSDEARYVKSLGRELWVYGVSGEKTVSPMQGYRLMAWRAFRGGATGIGFWAYADTGREGTAWSDIDGLRPDFSVIYEGNNTIISSKRWEAWREGCEDYALLGLAERNLGSEEEKAEFHRRLNRVISNPDDFRFFEETRRFLLEIASRKQE